MSKTMSSVTFEDLKIKYENKLSKDSEVKCRVLTKIKDGYIVDINNEWEGFIPNSHFTNDENTLSEEVTAVIISGPDKSDRYMVSPRVLKEKAIWEKLQTLKSEESTLKVTIAKVIKGGVEVYIDSLRAFLPGRYIRLIGIAQENWVGQEIDVIIEELNQEEKKIILNQKKAIDLDKQKKVNEILNNLKEGDIVVAPVLRIADFGVFVGLGGIDGLIPASELGWGRYNHPKEIVNVGDELKAVIFRIEKESQKIALSVKKLLGDPWKQVKSKIELGMLIEGKVIAEAQFGVFIELMPGIEALLHNSEIPEGTEKPKAGSVIISRIVKLDLDQKKIGLSLFEINTDTIESTKLNPNENTALSVNPESNGNGHEIEIPSVSLEDFALCSLETEEALNN